MGVAYCAHLMPGATDDGGEDSTRGVVSGKSGFAHAGSVVNNQCGDFIFHGWTIEQKKRGRKAPLTPSTQIRFSLANSHFLFELGAVPLLGHWGPLKSYIPATPDKRRWSCILLLPYKDMVRFGAALRLLRNRNSPHYLRSPLPLLLHHTGFNSHQGA